MTLDLRSKEGHGIFLELVKRFDMVVENFTLGTMEGFGLGYDDLRVINPSIIYGTVKGFGRSGPYATFKSFDGIAQAAGGASSLTGPEAGPPMRPGAYYGDSGSGITLALALVAAYLQRLRTGEGQIVDVSMQEVVATFMRTPLSYRARTGPVHPRTPIGKMYPCAPGGPNDYVTLTILTSGMWDSLCLALGRPELTVDERFESQQGRTENAEELDDIIRDWTGRRTKFEAMRELGAAGVPNSAVFDTSDLLSDEHLVSRGFVSEVRHPTEGSNKFLSPPFRLSASTVAMKPSPLLSQHTSEVLRAELGMSADKVSGLAERGVIRLP